MRSAGAEQTRFDLELSLQDPEQLRLPPLAGEDRLEQPQRFFRALAALGCALTAAAAAEGAAAVAAGRRILITHAEDLMETRMYRSLRGIIEGWTKNLATGSRRASPAWAAPVVPWLIALFLIGMWVVPPVILLTMLMTPLGGWVQGWSLAITAASLLFWLLAHAVQRVPLPYALTYPVGALAAAGLMVRSVVMGPRVAWKGREYRVDEGSRSVERASNV